MSAQTSDNNKRIAKNTLVLYFRMLFMMAVSLYTSRVVLNTLGVVDYGIYNVVGGVVAMFGFLNAAMSSATSRYITFELGRENKRRLNAVFSTALQIHCLIALLIVILAETVGLWFFYHKMQIPAERITAAFWVLQLSIVDSVVMIVSVPYNATIVAHERMSAFAYISVFEAIAKLAVVYLLAVSPIDKLIFYAVLLLVVQLFLRFCYGCYCSRHFEETKCHRMWDRALFKEMTSYATWSIFGNLSATVFTTGLNMLLNVFFGPVVNAARGIAVQIQGAVQQFVGNFQMALNPQIIKNYARGEMEEMYGLMYRSARFSFYLLFFLSLPVLFETNIILKVWLGKVPEHSVVFLRIILCTSLIYTLSNPLIIANQATGKVKKYQAVCGTTLIMILPISYLALELGLPAYSVFIVHFVMEAVCQLARMVMLRPLIGLRLRNYVRHVYSYIVMVVVFSVIVPAVVYASMPDTLLRFFVVGVCCVLSVGIVVYRLGLTPGEKIFVLQKVKQRIDHFKH